MGYPTSMLRQAISSSFVGADGAFSQNICITKNNILWVALAIDYHQVRPCPSSAISHNYKAL
eukprot:UN24495